MLKYRVFRPGAGVVSWHRTEAGANRSLARQIRGSEKQGGYNQDRVQEFRDNDWWPRFNTSAHRWEWLGDDGSVVLA